MAEFSKIAWCDGTFNPWIGCSRVSPGCQNCYAENLMDNRYHRVKWGAGNPRVRTKTWNDPIKWNRLAEKEGIRKKVFCASLADWLDEEVSTQWREDLIDLIESCSNIDWLMLTKRIENYEKMVPPKWLDNPLKNVWIGTTAEDQKYWGIRVPILEKIPAAIRWVSYEPALGPIEIPIGSNVDWVIIGGESNQSDPAREFNLDWARNVISQCRSKGIVPFVKQFGSNVYEKASSKLYKSKDASDPSEWPDDLKIREFPR